MKFLRNVGPLVARHYEKLIVALALIGFLGAVVYLYGVRNAEQEKIAEYDRDVRQRKGNLVPQVDLNQYSSALEKAKNPPALDFGLPHNLFNPVKWQKRPDGTILKIERGTEVGAAALKIVKIDPLRTVINIDRVTPGGLYMGALPEAATNAAMRRKFSQYLTTNTMHTTKLFTLRDIRGEPDKPEAVIELASGEKETVTLEKPYTRVEGFRVDLQYPPEGNRAFNDRRVGDKLTLGGEEYIIVAITENEVVVSASSNNRRTTIRK